MATAVMFMLIGCSNVANLLLARGEARQREIAIRMAIGAGPGRILRQLLTESCVLAVIGGLGGFALVTLAWTLLPSVVPISIPRLSAARADTATLAFALGTAVLNGLLFGILPAVRAARARRTAMTSPRPGRALMLAQVAIAMSLVAIASQLLANFAFLMRSNPGFEASGLVASIVLPTGDRYRAPAAHGQLYRRILDSVRALPGVESAGTVDALPFSGENHGGFVSASEAALSRPEGRIIAEVDVVSPGYLETMRVRLLEGRRFRPEELTPSSDVAIVSDSTAGRLWPGESALGKSICVHCTPDRPRTWRRVVGVVSSVRHMALDESRSGAVFVPAGALEQAAFLVVRTSRPAGDIGSAIRRAIAAIDPNQPVFLTASMSSMLADSVADRRFVMTLMGLLGALALSMSAAGVYGVLSYATSRRGKEMSIRLAVGATSQDILALVFRQGFRAVGAGIALGLIAALAGMRTLRSLLPGLESTNPAQIGVAVAVVALAAGVACWIPARRAMRTDPVTALRQD